MNNALKKIYTEKLEKEKEKEKKKKKRTKRSKDRKNKIKIKKIERKKNQKKKKKIKKKKKRYGLTAKLIKIKQKIMSFKKFLKEVINKKREQLDKDIE